MSNSYSTPLLRLENIQKSFTNPEGNPLLVLDDIQLEIQEGEIAVFLGKSGCGKSTLLRIMAGLTEPTQGRAYFRGTPILKPTPGIAMVFQNFALLPWLSVLENVELGLEALGISRDLRRQKALEAIDTIGLDGFESAYPKELSGGMRQRVGLARALVVEPQVLLMDEPFSSLDILTSENLRNDLIDLWVHKRTQTKAILCVTHNIEEALLMANRIFLFVSDPGKIQTELNIDLPFPRNSSDPAFRDLLDHIYTLITVSERERLSKAKLRVKVGREIKPSEFAYRIPEVSISELTGLLESMESYIALGKVDLPELADALHLDVDTLLPLTETLDMLRFAKITKGDLHILEAGKQFIEADIQARKQIFQKHLLEHIPLAAHIRTVLDKEPDHQMPKRHFIEELMTFFSEEESERLLKVIIDWGRYAEAFAYDFDTELLSLENPQ